MKSTHHIVALPDGPSVLRICGLFVYVIAIVELLWQLIVVRMFDQVPSSFLMLVASGLILLWPVGWPRLVSWLLPSVAEHGDESIVSTHDGCLNTNAGWVLTDNATGRSRWSDVKPRGAEPGGWLLLPFLTYPRVARVRAFLVAAGVVVSLTCSADYLLADRVRYTLLAVSILDVYLLLNVKLLEVRVIDGAAFFATPSLEPRGIVIPLWGPRRHMALAVRARLMGRPVTRPAGGAS